jgi:hypothetical protein
MNMILADSGIEILKANDCDKKYRNGHMIRNAFVLRKSLIHAMRCFGVVLLLTGVSWGQQKFEPWRCELHPLPNRQVAFSIDGVQKTRWHFGRDSPGPFLYPFNGPSGVSLTRMGHPGAENHDHHRSVWLACQNVNGLDFWSADQGTRIRQKHWYRYRDGNEEAVMASRLGWYDPDGNEVMDQDLVIAIRPLPNGEHEVEFQLTLRPSKGVASVTLGKTSFGLLAVRVSKSLSAHFGGGQLTNAAGAVGEKNVFGESARWMDYTGPVIVGTGTDRKAVAEGVTFHDHSGNVGYPTAWHVRSDGWMGASFGMHEGHVIGSDTPLTLRYLLHVHRGPCNQDLAGQRHAAFAGRSGFRIFRPGSKVPHLQYEVARGSSE